MPESFLYVLLATIQQFVQRNQILGTFYQQQAFALQSKLRSCKSKHLPCRILLCFANWSDFRVLLHNRIEPRRSTQRDVTAVPTNDSMDIVPYTQLVGFTRHMQCSGPEWAWAPAMSPYSTEYRELPITHRCCAGWDRCMIIAWHHTWTFQSNVLSRYAFSVGWPVSAVKCGVVGQLLQVLSNFMDQEINVNKKWYFVTW